MSLYATDWPSSLWAQSAAPYTPSAGLAGKITVDVVIIGGGFTGLSAAHRFVERGVKPAVLEANGIGWGASGRNGGVVSPKFRVAIPVVARNHGMDVARRMAALGHEAVDAVRHFVERYAITNAALTLNGNLRCAHTSGALDALRAEAAIMHDQFGDGTMRVLRREEMIEETGSDDFVGGVLTADGGLIHPLNYVRGLAAGLRRRNVPIYENTAATAVRRIGDRIVVETPSGLVEADRVLVASNGYSDLAGGTAAVRQSVIPFRSAMVATGPLPDRGARLLKHGRSYSETRRMMRWFRPFEDRLIFGGRGAFGKSDSAAAFAALEKAMVRVFPVLKDMPVTQRWSGLVAMTLDAVPRIGRLDERTTFALGYNGAGIAMASLMGGYAADTALGDTPDLAMLGPRKLGRVPFYSLREPGVRAVAGWYQFLDAIGR